MKVQIYLRSYIYILYIYIYVAYIYLYIYIFFTTAFFSSMNVHNLFYF